MSYICEELDDLERKADKDGKLSMAEIEYGDKLAHFKKNLLSSEEMWDNKQSMAGGSYEGGGSYDGSYARNRGGRSYARGNRSGRRGANQYGSYNSPMYSQSTEDMVESLRDIMQEAPDERTRMEFDQFIKRLEQM
jgi:hypothetical protein